LGRRKLIHLLLIVAISLISIQNVNAQEEKPILVIHKAISDSNFSWSEKVEVSLTVMNIGTADVKGGSIVDYLPAGFVAESSQQFALTADKLTANIDEIKFGGEFTVTYKLSAEKSISSNEPVTIHLPRAEIHYTDGTSGETNSKSNQLTITVNPTDISWTEIAGMTFLFIVVSFGVGTLGTAIHNANIEKESENEGKKNNESQNTRQAATTQATTTQPTPIGTPAHTPPNPLKGERDGKTITDDKTTSHGKKKYSIFIGGTAGIFVLASFEGLSALFSNGALQSTVQNWVVLVATCLAAGFTPVAVIDKMTSKFKTEAEDAKKQKALLEDLNKEIKEKKAEIEKQNEIINNKNKELNAELGESWKVVKLEEIGMKQLQTEYERLKARLSLQAKMGRST
jgi:hypothetical protein